MPTNETILKRFNDKIAQLFQESRDADEAKNAAIEDADKYIKGLQSNAVGSKITNFYVRIMQLVPQEKRAEIHAVLREEYKKAIGERKFNAFLTIIEADTDVLVEREKKDQFLLYKCPADIIKHGLYERFLSLAVKEVEENELQKVIDEIDDFRAPETHNIPVFYYKQRVEEIKQRNREKNLEPALLAELDKELDIVANTVITSSSEYSKAQDGLDGIYDSRNNWKDHNFLKETIKKDEYQYLEEYLGTNGGSFHDCVRPVKEEHRGNTKIYQDIQDEKLRFEVPKKTQDSLKKIIGFMHERGMITKGYGSGEDGSKAYGFRQIASATIELEQAMQTTDPAKIREARIKYEQSLENMREVFKMIQEEFNPDEDMYVGNIDSYRETWVPAEFKNNIVYNALASGIYNLGLTLENNDVTLDALFENPNKVLVNIISGHVKTQTPNELLKSNSIGFNMLAILQDEINPYYPLNAVSRNVELLLRLSTNEQNKDRNMISAMCLQSFERYADCNIRCSDGSSLSGYASQNVTLTFANIFLVNDEDRNYDNLRAFEAYTTNGEKKISAFNTFEYTHSHKIDPTALVARIQSTMDEVMSAKNQAGNAKHIAKIIRGAQLAAFEYLSVHTTPDEGYDVKSYDALKEMISNPKKAFESAYAAPKIEAAIEKMPPIQDFVKDIQNKGKKEMKTLQKNAHRAEKAYNNAVDSLTKTMDKLAQKIAKGRDVEKNNQALEEAKLQLAQLKNIEIRRLNESYCKGEMPKDYFENRKLNVENGKHNEVAYFGVSEFPKFSAFKKRYAEEMKNGELSTEEVEFFYQRALENAQIEENKLHLTISKLQRLPKLEEIKEEAAHNMVENAREPIIVKEVNGEQPEQVSQIIQENQLETTMVKE